MCCCLAGQFLCSFVVIVMWKPFSQSSFTMLKCVRKMTLRSSSGWWLRLQIWCRLQVHSSLPEGRLPTGCEVCGVFQWRCPEPRLRVLPWPLISSLRNWRSQAQGFVLAMQPRWTQNPPGPSHIVLGVPPPCRPCPDSRWHPHQCLWLSLLDGPWLWAQSSPVEMPVSLKPRPHLHGASVSVCKTQKLSPVHIPTNLCLRLTSKGHKNSGAHQKCCRNTRPHVNGVIKCDRLFSLGPFCPL